MSDYLAHEGVAHDENPPGRGSGRYEWGSGEDPYQHQKGFLAEVRKYREAKDRKTGERLYTELEIAQMLLGEKAKVKDLKTTESAYKEMIRGGTIDKALALFEKTVDAEHPNGNKSEVARQMGVIESDIRKWLDPKAKERALRYRNTAEIIAATLANGPNGTGVMDIGKNTEFYLGTGITESTKDVAVRILQEQGYFKAYITVGYNKGGKNPTVMVLADPRYAKREKIEIKDKDGNVIGEKLGDYILDDKGNKVVDYSAVAKVVKSGKMETIQEFTPDNGKTYWTPKYPESLDSNRIFIRYDDDPKLSGSIKDGVIEIKRGVEDLSLGSSRYAQVRIMVDDNKYLKGMAIYGEDKDFPPGCDVIVNSNKKSGTPDYKVFKVCKGPDEDVKKLEADGVSSEKIQKMLDSNRLSKVDKENPFGALIKANGQRTYIDENGNEKQSLVNKVREEGDWDTWSKTLATQFLSKQNEKLITQQLKESLNKKSNELKEILDLDNEVLKKKMLESYARKCDANAVDMSAAGFKEQAYQVLIPSAYLPDDTVYAPKYKTGEKVAIIRYPHAGTFEIVIATVDNEGRRKDDKQLQKGIRECKKILGNSPDAICINSHNAQTLSGADYDGDTGLVIPMTTNNVSIDQQKRDTKALQSLSEFDPKAKYKLPESQKGISYTEMQKQMGIVTNLLTDMSLNEGATLEDKVAVAKHTMVIIDSYKHHLDYKQSYRDNKIDEINKKYRNGKTGASTLLSRSTGDIYIPERREINNIKKMTSEQLADYNLGKKVYEDTGKIARKPFKDYDKMEDWEKKAFNAGKTIYRDDPDSPKLTKTARGYVYTAKEMLSENPSKKELIYADYSDGLRDLANVARREARSIKAYKIDDVTKKTYADEVASLKAKLKVAQMNSPKERAAQAMADSLYKTQMLEHPDMDGEHKARAWALALTRSRAILGSGKEQINITDDEWKAIKAKAVPSTVLSEIIDNTDQEAFKKRCTPSKSTTIKINTSQKAKILSMYRQGIPLGDIASQFGISTSYISVLASEANVERNK